MTDTQTEYVKENETQYYLGIWYKNRSPNLGQKTWQFWLIKSRTMSLLENFTIP